MISAPGWAAGVECWLKLKFLSQVVGVGFVSGDFVE